MGRHRLVPFAAAAGVAGFVVLLGILRRQIDRPLTDDLYLYGNTLGTLDVSGYPWRTYHEDLARVEFAVLAALAVGVAVHASKRIGLATVAAVLASVCTDSLTRLATHVNGRLYVSICDDAMISMRYARNFAEGRGLVYNAGEYVDGFSNPLWTLLMIIPHALGMHEGVTTIPILVVGGLALVGAAIFSWAVLDREGVPAPLMVLAFLAIGFDSATFEYATSGLETTALTFGSAAVMFGAQRKKEWLIATGLVVLALSRADGSFVAALLAAWLVREEMLASGDGLKLVVRRHVAAFAAFGAAAVGLILWRIAVYGHPAPNTAYLKVFSLSGRVLAGIASYGQRGLLMYGLPTAFVFLSPVVDDRVWRARRMMLPVLAVWAYGMYVGGDAFFYMRFIAPVTPLLWCAVALTAASCWESWALRTKVLAFGALALLVPVKSERGTLGLVWEHKGWVDDCLVAAKSIEKNVPDEATIGTFYAGFAYYAPHHRFVDLLGKTESHIAHEERIHGIIPGHNKFDFAYAYEVRKPDVTLTALNCPDVDTILAQPIETRQAALANMRPFEYHAPLEQMLDPTFLSLYAPHRVVLKDGDATERHRLGCWFVREGARVPTEWQLARQ